MHRALERMSGLLGDNEIKALFAFILAVTAIATAICLQSCFWGFIQDDAYISMRYARNCVNGLGLVFNPGERVEGFTNFLWTMFSALILALGFDPVIPLIVIGSVSGVALVCLTLLLAGAVRGSARLHWDVVGALFLCCSTTLALWSVSGLEQSFFALVGWAGITLLLTGRPGPASLFFCLAFLTRPEGVLFPVFGAAAVVLRAHTEREKMNFTRCFKPFALLLFVFFAYHGWRCWYFGGILPNTYLIKGGGGWTNIRFGWMNMKKLLVFNNNWILILLAHLSLFRRRGRAVSAVMLLFLDVYLLYEIKIGGDILPMFRLHMTVLPIQAVLAARSIEIFCDVTGWAIKERYLPHRRLLLPLALLPLLGFIVNDPVRESINHPEYRGVRKSLDSAHGAIGRFLARNCRPGDVVVAQDMGALPWNAPDVVFLDTIGLVDATIGKEHFATGYTPYIRYLLWESPDAVERIQKMEYRLRRYVFSRNPRYFVVNVDFPAAQREKVMDALRARVASFFDKAVEANVFFYDIGKAPEWREYSFVKGWSYSTEHYLLLYERTSRTILPEDGS